MDILLNPPPPKYKIFQTVVWQDFLLILLTDIMEHLNITVRIRVRSIIVKYL